MKSLRANVMELSTSFLVVIVVCLGGASQGNAVPLALTEFLALPVLVLAIMRTTLSWEEALIFPVIVLLALVLIPIAQLVPLPPSVWTHLPGRSGIVAVFQSAQMQLPPLPLSLTPYATAHCALALIPPIALFLAMRSLATEARARVVLVVVAMAFGSITLGLLQVSQNETHGLRLYSYTSNGVPIGFFANRDHFADFLACAIPLAAGGLTCVGQAGSPLRTWAGRSILLIAPVLVMGIAITASRAGFILGFIGMVAAILLGRIGGRHAAWPGLTLATTVGVLLIIAALSDRLPAVARFAETGPDLRFTAAPFVAAAARTYWPIGSGVGSFIPIFQTVQPTALVETTYLNHAHDEFLEATLESGVAAWAVFVAFVIWWLGRGLASLQCNTGRDARLGQAGFVVVAMILLHAAVDFPLRTVTLMSVFAMGCALMTAIPATVPDRLTTELSVPLDAPANVRKRGIRTGLH